jgi:hypothetical protein
MEVVRHTQALGAVPARTIQDQDDLPGWAGSDSARKSGQVDFEEGDADRSRQMEEGCMRDRELHPSVDVAAADWLQPRLRPFASAVAAVVPDGFPAYVRLVHPAPGDSVNPPQGSLPTELLHVLCATLAEHTSMAAACYFCLWDGYGWLQGSPAIMVLTRRRDDARPTILPQPIPPAASPEGLLGPRVRLPYRDYLLFTGPLETAYELGATIGGTSVAQSPNLFWPQDHAWCVASEIDLTCTLVAGSELLAQALLANPSLQARSVDPSDALTCDTD